MTTKYGNKNNVMQLLSDILASDEFASSPQLQRFLEYVVTQEIEHKGAGIKAYSIGVDALGRSEDFDPQSDNIVRVTAGRLRKSLANYYHNSDQPHKIRIILPTGSYRPEFVLTNGDVADLQADSAPEETSRLSFGWTWALAIVAIFLAVGLTFSLYLPQPRDDSVGTTDLFRADMPILEIALVEPTGDADLDLKLDGLRHRVAEDLSRFRIARIRLRDHQADSNGRSKANPAPRFAVRGVVVGMNPDILQFSVADLSDNTILWSETIELPDSWSSYDQLINEGVSRVVLKMVGSRGAIPIALEKELDDFRKRKEPEITALNSGFSCVLTFHAFDASKSELLRTDARRCLSALVSRDNQDSEVWAAWAMVNFLDWTRSQNHDQLENALIAARKAVSMDSNYANAHEYLGSILMAKGNRDLARDSYRAALKLNPYKPDLHVLVGWEEALGGDWANGIQKIERGISIDPNPAAWMRIPLALDAFRRNDFSASLFQSELMIEAGDGRGIVLALAAVVAMEDYPRASELSEAFLAQVGSRKSDPMREVRSVFNDSELLQRYDELLEAWFLEPT